MTLSLSPWTCVHRVEHGHGTLTVQHDAEISDNGGICAYTLTCQLFALRIANWPLSQQASNYASEGGTKKRLISPKLATLVKAPSCKLINYAHN